MVTKSNKSNAQNTNAQNTNAQINDRQMHSPLQPRQMSYRPVDDEVGVKIELREWELNENSTTYDRIIAAPSDETMRVQWILFIATMMLSLAITLFVFASTLRDKKCRTNPFNTYMLFIMAPEIFLNLACVVNCSLNLHIGRYFSVNACIVQSFYSVFAATTGPWIVATVVYQVHTMLKCSRNAIRYHPPTRIQAAKHCFAVYAYALVLSSWTNWGPWMRDNVFSGILCIPMAYDFESTLFVFLVAVPALMLVPNMYIIYVVADIWYRDLLPKETHRKELMIFLKFLLVYFLSWFPALAFMYVGGHFFGIGGSWVVFTGAAWTHFQGTVSAGICLFKKDIQRACRNSLSCCHSPRKDHVQSKTPTKDKAPMKQVTERSQGEPPSSYLDDLGLHDGFRGEFQEVFEKFLGIRDSFQDTYSRNEEVDDLERNSKRRWKTKRVSCSGKTKSKLSAYEVSMVYAMSTIPSENIPEALEDDNDLEGS